MPTMAFAALAHTSCNPVLPDNNGDGKYEWSDVETILGGNDASYVDVVKKPTHTEKGKVVITCKEDYCKEKTEYTIEALGHNDFVAKDLTLEEYAAGIVARGDYSPMDNQYEANAWVKKQKALNICYVKNAYVCSCGRVEWREGTLPADEKSALVAHDRGDVPACTDATCVKCGVALKGTGHKANTDVAANFEGGFLKDDKVVAADKVSEPDCGKGAGYKWACKHCGKKVAVVYTNHPTNAAHNYGTPVDVSVATTITKDGKYAVKSGYVGVKLPATADNVRPYGSTPITNVTDFKFYKLNKVVTPAAGCNTTQTMGLECETCGKVLPGSTENTTVTHDWEKTHVAATCDHAGYNTYLCKVCGVAGNDTNGKPAKEELATEPKLSHNYKVTKVPASCSNAKEYYVIECTTCDSKKCNHTYDGTTTAGKLELKNNATVDDVNIFDVTPATADPAKTKTLAWTGFDNELKGAKVMEFTFDLTAHPSHKYGAEEIVKAATCTTDAVYGKKCSECGKVNTAAVYTKPNTRLGHTVVKNEVAATCGTAGYYTEKCSTCGFVKNVSGNMVDPSTIDGTDPDKTVKKTATDKALVKDGAKCTFDKWVVTKASTVFEEGVKTLTCSVCGAHDATKTVIAKKTVAKASNTVKAGKKSFNVKSSAANATGYRVYYKKAGAKSWKSYTKKTTSLSKTFSGLSKGKYYVKVRAYAKNYDGDGQVVWGATSSTKSVKVK